MSYEDGMPAGGTSRFRGYSSRMSERQQLALLLQMSSQEMISGTDVTGAAGSSDESVTAGPDNPCSPAERGGATVPPSSEQDQQQQQQQQQQQIYQQHNNAQCQQQQQQRAAGSVAAVASHVAENSGAPCEMRRTPPQNKVDRSGTGQSGSSPRVTLRLNQVRGTRDEKKGTGASNSRQGGISAQGQGSMETSSKTSGNASSGSTNAASNTGTSGNTSSSDSGDVYEFKSSKEPTPVRGASTSPNPNPDKDKDGSGKPSASQGNQGTSNNATTGGSSTSSSEATTAPLTSDEASAATTSPSSKRTFEGGDNTEEQDDENRRKKRKDTETAKENTKTNTTGRQNTSRNAASSGEKCAKSGKQGSGTTSGKGNQNASSVSADRKSPSTSSMASSPKPSNTPSSTNTKTATPAPLESDSEEDRLKCSDSNSAPKVPPLKIVIPQSTTSEQEQGNRNGKNITNRSHQLPYVVASSNSNDSLEKDQSQSTSGTTSPTEGSTSTKGEDKKDFGAILHGEERSTHHQRVLRSSHRTGNGNNGSTVQKESTPSSGNGSYSNSSPLPANASMDRSNNSSPLQRHHSPTPETAGSDANKTSSSESANTGTASKSSATVEKSDKNMDSTGKNQKDSNAETVENVSSVTSSAISNTNTPAPPVELHPRKRKMKPNKEAQQAATAANEAAEATSTGPEIHPHDQPITNCYQLFLNIRKQIERRRKGLFPVQPKPPQGFKDYLMNRCTYVLAGNVKHEPNINPPVGLHAAMKDLYVEQEKERYRLRMQHVVEKEKLVLSVEQEILRVHGRAARALANQSLPFSVCTILKDEEVYNVITPEQEEKDRNARSRYNGRLFLSWLQDVDDKWEKIKEGMLLRHHNEADSLHAVQRMHWEWKLKEVGLCESKVTPQIEDVHVPMVHVSDDFDLLPA